MSKDSDPLMFLYLFIVLASCSLLALIVTACVSDPQPENDKQEMKMQQTSINSTAAGTVNTSFVESKWSHNKVASFDGQHFYTTKQPIIPKFSVHPSFVPPPQGERNAAVELRYLSVRQWNGKPPERIQFLVKFKLTCINGFMMSIKIVHQEEWTIQNTLPWCYEPILSFIGIKWQISISILSDYRMGWWENVADVATSKFIPPKK